MHEYSLEERRMALELIHHPGFKILEKHISDKIEEENYHSELTITKLTQVWESEEHKGAKKALKSILVSFLDFANTNPINIEE